MSDRRAFVHSTVAAFAASPLLLRLGRSQTSSFRWTKVRDDAWVVERGGGNTTVLTERDGAVVIDLKMGGIGLALRREIEEKVGPIQAVIVTHHHGDHAGGLHAFRSIRGFGQAKGFDRLKASLANIAKAARTDQPVALDQIFANLDRDFEYPRNPASEADIKAFLAWTVTASPADALPAVAVDQRLEERFGRSTLRMIHAGNAHTDNDLFIIDRNRRFLVTGDLLFQHHHPFVDVSAGATTTGWQSVLDAMMAEIKQDWIVVPGHGPVTDRSGLVNQRAYFDTVRSVVAEARRAGKSRDETIQLPNKFPNYGFSDLWRENLGVCFDEAR